MKYYKLIVNKYNIFANDYITSVSFIQCEDIYHYIGVLYCKTIESIKRIDYQEISFDTFNNSKDYFYLQGKRYEY